MIHGIWFIILKLPGFIAALEKISRIVLIQIRRYRRKKALQEMDRMIIETTKTKDTSQLDSLFNGDKKG